MLLKGDRVFMCVYGCFHNPQVASDLRNYAVACLLALIEGFRSAL